MDRRKEAAMNDDAPEGRLLDYFRLEIIAPTASVMALTLVLYFLNTSPHDLYLALAALTGGALLGEIAWAPRERTFMQDLNTLSAGEARNALTSHTDTNHAFWLGCETTRLPTLSGSSQQPTHLEVIHLLYNSLGILLAPKDERLVRSGSLQQLDAQRISESLRTKAQALRPTHLWSFFQLGHTLEWLFPQLTTMTRTREALDSLERFQADKNLRFDRRYVALVDDLVKVLRPYRNQVPSLEREALTVRVSDLLKNGPGPDLQPSSTAAEMVALIEQTVRRGESRSEWQWVAGGDAVRMIGSYMVIQRSAEAGTYEVAALDIGLEERTTIRRRSQGWECSAHPDMAGLQSCWEIDLVLDASDDGKPVVEARVRPIRLVPVPRRGLHWPRWGGRGAPPPSSAVVR